MTVDDSPSFPRTLAPLGWLSGPFLRARRAASRGRGERLGVPVVSVGNLCLGGTGKTPVVRAIAGWLSEMSRHVAVLSRGYGRPRPSDEVVRVSRRGQIEVLSWELAGDEPWMLASSLPGCSVYVCPDRVAAGRAAIRDGADVLLLDDGFQHFEVARELDVVCLTGGERGMRVLPAGPLREPVSALADAGVALRVSYPGMEAEEDGGDGAERLRELLRPGAVWAEAVSRPAGLTMPDRSLAEPSTLNGARVGLLCAVARNARFVNTVRSLGARIEALHTRRDHHVFGDEELADLRQDLLWVTTEKDAVRIERRMPVAVLRMQLGFEEGEAGMRQRIERAVGGTP